MIFLIQFKLQIHDDDDVFEVVCQPNVKLKSVREVNLSFSCQLLLMVVAAFARIGRLMAKVAEVCTATKGPWV